MLRYAWQNTGYGIEHDVINFKGVIGVAFSIDIIECAVMTCDHLAFLHCAFFSYSYCFEYFIESCHLRLSGLRVAFTMTFAVTSRACLHSSTEK